MGIALLSIADLLTPLQSLADRWMPRRRASAVLSSGLRYVGVRPNCTLRQMGASPASARAPVRPLRVVRMVDAQQPGRPGRAAGRMVISGRLADVCAELDRLVALEAAEAVPRPAHLH